MITFTRDKKLLQYITVQSGYKKNLSLLFEFEQFLKFAVLLKFSWENKI